MPIAHMHTLTDIGKTRLLSPAYLKEYYEIVDEARPLSGFVPTHADFFTEMHF